MRITELPTYHIAALQSRSNRAFKTRMGQLLQKHNITTMQWSVIGMVSDSGDAGVRISDLATSLDTSMAFITTTINVLEAKGVVQKSGHSHDSRSKIVRISGDFKQSIKAIESELHKDMSKWLEEQTGESGVDSYIKAISAMAGA